MEISSYYLFPITLHESFSPPLSGELRRTVYCFRKRIAKIRSAIDVASGHHNLEQIESVGRCTCATEEIILLIGSTEKRP